MDPEGNEVIAANMDVGVQLRRSGGGFEFVALGQMESDKEAARGGYAGFQETSAI
jgi:hypothetical protein